MAFHAGRARVVLGVFLFPQVLVFGQLISRPFEAFSTSPFLNPEIICSLGICELKGKIITKYPEGEFVWTKGYVNYQFDSLGRTLYMQTYKPYKSFKDSVIHQFEYKDSQMIKEYHHDKTGYHILKYTYFNQNLVESEEWMGLKKKNQEVLIHHKEYIHSNTAEGIRTQIYFKGGNLFETQFKILDSTNRLEEKCIFNHATEQKNCERIIYNPMFLPYIKYLDSGNNKDYQQIEYTNTNEVNAIKNYKSGVLTSETQVIYDAITKGLKTIILLDHTSQLMEIIQF